MTPIASGDWFRIAFRPAPLYCRIIARQGDQVQVEWSAAGQRITDWTRLTRLCDPDVTPVTAEEGETAWLLDVLTT